MPLQIRERKREREGGGGGKRIMEYGDNMQR